MWYIMNRQLDVFFTTTYTLTYLQDLLSKNDGRYAYFSWSLGNAIFLVGKYVST